MAVAAVNIPVTQGGTTVLRVDCESQQSGNSNDRVQFRVVRRVSGRSDVVLPSNPQFVLPSNRDVRGWTFFDTNVPDTGNYAYVLQMNKLAGGGTFYAMSLSATHFRK